MFLMLSGTYTDRRDFTKLSEHLSEKLASKFSLRTVGMYRPNVLPLLSKLRKFAGFQETARRKKSFKTSKSGVYKEWGKKFCTASLPPELIKCEKL